jgi:cysteine-rich repeat protein
MAELGGFALPWVVACGPSVTPYVYTTTDDEDSSSSDGDADSTVSVTLGTTVGTSITGDDTTESSSSGPPTSTCGDALVEGAEECDDGNTDLGDGCEDDCRFSPGTILWSRSIDGGAGLNDFATSLAVGPTGTVYVAGGVEDGSTANAWIGILDIDGELLDELVFDAGDDEIANSVVVDEADTLWVVGQDLDEHQALLLRGDGDALVQDGNGGAHDLPFPTRGVAATGGGLFTSRQESIETGWSYAIDLRDPSGTPIWTAQDAANVLVSDMVATPEGGVVLAGQIENEAGHDQVWLRELGSDGSTLWTYADDMVDYDDESTDAVILSTDGTLLAGGQREIPGFGYVPFIAELDRTGALVDLRDVSIGEASFWLYALVDDGAGLVVAGAAYPDNTPSDAVIATLDDDGTVRWGASYDDALGFNDNVRALARIPTSHDLIAVGTDVASGESDNIWVARIRG